MTLLHVDSFDHYTSLAQKYESVPGSGPTISASFARTGTAGFQNTSTGAVPIKLVGVAGEHATFIAGIALRRTTTLAGTGTYLQFLSDTAATAHVTLTADASGKLNVRRGDRSGTLLGSEPGNTLGVLNAWHYVELKSTLSDTVGIVQVRVDGNTTPVINLSAQDTKNAGTKTVFDSVGFGSEPSFGNTNSDDFYICNAAGSVNNDFLGDIKIEALIPTADGATSGLTPSTGTSHFALVDEIPPNTTDYVSSPTNAAKDTWGYANTTIAGTVKGVQVNTYAQKSDALAKSFRPVIRHSGTDYAGTDQALGTGFGYYRQLYETNPGTAAAWTTSDVDAAEFGAEVRP